MNNGTVEDNVWLREFHIRAKERFLRTTLDAMTLLPADRLNGVCNEVGRRVAEDTHTIYDQGLAREMELENQLFNARLDAIEAKRKSRLRWWQARLLVLKLRLLLRHLRMLFGWRN